MFTFSHSPFLFLSRLTNIIFAIYHPLIHPGFHRTSLVIGAACPICILFSLSSPSPPYVTHLGRCFGLVLCHQEGPPRLRGWYYWPTWLSWWCRHRVYMHVSWWVRCIYVMGHVLHLPTSFSELFQNVVFSYS